MDIELSVSLKYDSQNKKRRGWCASHLRKEKTAVDCFGLVYCWLPKVFSVEGEEEGGQMKKKSMCSKCGIRIISKWVYCPECGKRINPEGRTTQLITLRLKTKTLEEIKKAAHRSNVSRNHWCSMILTLGLTMKFFKQGEKSWWRVGINMFVWLARKQKLARFIIAKGIACLIAWSVCERNWIQKERRDNAEMENESEVRGLPLCH